LKIRNYLEKYHTILCDLNIMAEIMNRLIVSSILIACCILGMAGSLRGEDTLTWKDCVMFAAENNPELISAFELVSQSKASLGIARSSYLPQISASVGINASKQKNVTDIDKIRTNNLASTGQITSSYASTLYNTTSRSTSNSFSYGISGTQLIFDSMKTIYDIKSAESGIDESRFKFIVTASQIRYSLRGAFVQLLKAQESIAIYKEIAQRQKKNLDLVTMRYRAGKEHRGSLMSSEANLADAKLNVVQAERSITVARRSLLKELGVSSLRQIRVEGTLAGKNDDRTKPDFDAIVRSHPAVMQIVKQRESARYSENARIASFMPVISATASAEKQDSFPKNSSSSMFGTTSTKSNLNGGNLSAGIQATMPLFTGGNNYYNLDKAKSQSRKLKADEANAREQVAVDLEQYWNNWQNAIDNVEVQRKFLAASEERARISEAEYSLGLLTFDNWIIIENQLSQSRKSYLEALANHLVAEAQWILAKGETLAYDK
jgi:outer membrane protein TolC